MILVFASSDVPADFARGQAAVTAYAEAGHEVRLVNKLSSNLDDLLLVTTFGVVEPVAVVVLDGAGRLAARFPKLVAVDDLAP